MIETLLTSGNIGFVAIAIMAAELFWFRRHIKRFPVIAFGLAAGMCLALALRSALLQHSWQAVAAFLTLGAMFHIAEVTLWHSMAKNS